MERERITVGKQDVDSNEIAEKLEDNEKILDRAKLYRKFGKVALALNNVENAAGGYEDSGNTSEEKQANALISQLEAIEQLKGALDSVDKSLERQIDYLIVNHKQINTRDALENELSSGSSIPELDIRFDKDGKPWISHSPRAGARFFFSKPIHTLNSDEVAEYGQRLSLEDGLELVKQYKDDNDKHRIVLEIKELGASEQDYTYLESIKGLLDKFGLTDSAIFATLSPSILKSTHDVFPENSKILNGGIAPVISYNIAKSSGTSGPNKEFAVKLPNVELFFSNSTKITDHADGYGKQTGYLWTRLPKETVDALSALNKDGKTGAASLTLINKFANVLEKINPKTAEKLRTYYAEQLEILGLKKQVAIAKNNPTENLIKTRAQMGEDIIFYSDRSPGNWAEDLPEIEEA